MACLDNLSIKFEEPKLSAYDYLDSNKNYSLNVMFLVNEKRNFLTIEVDETGYHSNQFVYEKSELFRQLKKGWRPFKNAIILANSSYSLTKSIITPIRPAITDDEKNFNKEHKKARRISIEEALRIFKVLN